MHLMLSTVHVFLGPFHLHHVVSNIKYVGFFKFKWQTIELSKTSSPTLFPHLANLFFSFSPCIYLFLHVFAELVLKPSDSLLSFCEIFVSF